MPTIVLNGHTAPALSCPADKSEIVFWSDDLTGFGLRCRSNGTKAWFVQYRTKTGETRRHSLGNPTTVTFTTARKKAKNLLAAAVIGDDPVGEARKARAQIKLGELVERYLAHQKTRLRPRSFVELERHLMVHVRSMHAQSAPRVTGRQIVEMLQRLAERAPITANRTRASLSAMFVWAMKSGLVPSNPVAATFRPAQEKSRERVLSDGELALIWRCTAGGSDHDRIVRLLMLTGSRREEIGAMRWSEITANQNGTTMWLLPPDRAKNGLPHQLTLPEMVVGLLPPRRPERDLLFGVGDGPFSGWARCKERLDQRIAAANDGQPIPPWVLHDLRRSFVTRLNDLGVEPHVIEAAINHVSGIARSGIAGTYNRSAYVEQKRDALNLWCAHISELTGDQGNANVTPLRRRGR